jgi:plasmid maintenance system antidote protein VapI
MRGEKRLDPAMAATLGEITGEGAAFWLKLQHEHDLAECH